MKLIIKKKKTYFAMDAEIEGLIVVKLRINPKFITNCLKI